ncbi:MAG: uncharacterized protein KVP18_001672 [Porospora cf. gigantea A]|uniref:uncharacterized protein n=1 Tax=Porospora cf. gigantea A TaxID=2853593 RepID=UPI00355A3A7F|nr:MAG: hypothetical protein KVP18_001672 [Porospora cf. gigantea A]
MHCAYQPSQQLLPGLVAVATSGTITSQQAQPRETRASEQASRIIRHMIGGVSNLEMARFLESYMDYLESATEYDDDSDDLALADEDSDDDDLAEREARIMSMLQRLDDEMSE